MDRIEINGVWYVKEATAEKEYIELCPTHFEGCVVENKDFCFEATRIFKDDGTPYDNCIDIECIDKRSSDRKDWKIENWDNNEWLRGVLKNNPESMSELPAYMGNGNVLFLQEFLQYLTDKDWL
jgi:hypothetical protein